MLKCLSSEHWPHTMQEVKKLKTTSKVSFPHFKLYVHYIHSTSRSHVLYFLQMSAWRRWHSFTVGWLLWWGRELELKAATWNASVDSAVYCQCQFSPKLLWSNNSEVSLKLFESEDSSLFNQNRITLEIEIIWQYKLQTGLFYGKWLKYNSFPL